MAPDDASLAERCLAGDAAAVQALIERFQSDVLGLCIRLLRHRQDAEDVTQETFLRVFRSLRRWDSSRPLKPWIMSIAVNRCKTWMAQRARRPQLVDHLHETVASPAVEEPTELVHEIQAATADLREDYRIVFTLFHEQGLAYDAIAEAVEKPVGTVKTWLHRARLEVMARLRQKGLAPEERDELS